MSFPYSVRILDIGVEEKEDPYSYYSPYYASEEDEYLDYIYHGWLKDDEFFTSKNRARAKRWWEEDEWKKDFQTPSTTALTVPNAGSTPYKKEAL